MSCGLEESVDKAVTPTTKMTFLGVTFDSEKMTLEVTPDKGDPSKHVSHEQTVSG
jgi:hypothetical protein